MENKDQCAFDQWVDNLAAFWKRDRHGSNVAVLIHSGPGGVEAIYSMADAVISEGMLKIASLALDGQVKSSLGIKVQEAKNSEAAAALFANDKLKVN